MKALKTHVLIIVLFVYLSSCDNISREPTPIEQSYKIVIGKTTEIRDGSALDRGYTKYLLAFDDGHTESTSFGLYTCIKISDTILFERKEGGWYWEMKSNCK